MPPKRKSGGPRTTSASQRQQSTLSFHGKQNKVTKPTSAPEEKAAKKDPAVIEAEFKAEDESALEEPTTAEAVTQQQAKDEAPDPLQGGAGGVKIENVLGGRAQESELGAVGGLGSGWVGDEEAQAREITDTQIKRYWRQKEQERLAPRVHQEDLTVYEKVLREWDMSGQYGVSIPLRE
jgi:DNA polymerase delta subunit 4